jgi:hypothetical protein
MRTCISCGDPIPETKRKDAKYCDMAACRGREYRKKRQAEATTSNSKRHALHASTVLACPCGRRYVLQICALDGPETGPATELGSAVAAPEALIQTVLPTDPQHGEPSPQADLDATASEAVTQSVLLTDKRPSEAPSAVPAAAHSSAALTQTDQTDPAETNLATLELYFTNGTERRIPFNQAVHRRSDGGWALHPHARVAFSFGEPNRLCLGGRPGAWRRFYGDRSPSEFGYDPDLVVMFWDQGSRRGRAASASVLRDILGEGWKEQLRQMCDEMQ